MNRRMTIRIAVVQLSLLLPVASHGQSRENVFSPPEPQQQRQFCAAFQEDTVRRNAYEAELAAAKARAAGNPIAERQIHIAEPDFESLFRAKQASVMGNGTFQNWVARVKVDLSSDKVFLSFGFPCKWTEYRYAPNVSEAAPQFSSVQTNDALSFGTAFPPRTGISVDSDLAKSLGSLRQGETVVVSGRFFCVAPAAPPLSARTGGCTRSSDGMFWASINSIRTARGGTSATFPNTRGQVSFSVSDDYSTMMQKAKASSASALGEYLGALYPIGLMPPTGNRGGKAGLPNFGDPLARLANASAAGSQTSTPMLPLSRLNVRIQGDMPSLIGQAVLEKQTPFPGKDGDCVIVSPDDIAELQARNREINRILVSLFDTGLSASNNGDAQPNSCIDENGQPKPASRTGSSTVYKVGEGVSAPVPIRKVDPQYADEAKKARLSGAVTLSVVVDENGLPQDITVVTGIGKGLDEKAIEAAQQWRFQPGMKNGRPVKTVVTLKLQFRWL